MTTTIAEPQAYERIVELMKDEIEEYVTIDKELFAFKDQIRGLQKKKKELAESIVQCMEENSIQVIKANNGHITLEKKNSPTALNKEIIKQMARERLNETDAESLAEDLMKNRPVVPRTSLKVTDASRGKKRR